MKERKMETTPLLGIILYYVGTTMSIDTFTLCSREVSMGKGHPFTRNPDVGLLYDSHQAVM